MVYWEPKMLKLLVMPQKFWDGVLPLGVLVTSLSLLGMLCTPGIVGGEFGGAFTLLLGGRGRDVRGCILQMHSGARWEVPNVMDPEQVEEWAQKLKYWQMTPIINRLYAERHGYRYIFTNGSEVEDPERHPSWWKVQLLRHNLLTRCDWALWLDSDIYLRMEQHSLPIEAFLKKLEANSTGIAEDGTHQYNWAGNPTAIVRPSQRDGPVALLPRNGNLKDGVFGEEWLNSGRDYVCAGFQMWKNSTRSIKLLDQWYAKSNPKFNQGGTWEQRYLNGHLIPENLDAFAIVPFDSVTGQALGKATQFARHLWTRVGAKVRSSEMRKALLGYLVLHNIQKEPLM